MASTGALLGGNFKTMMKLETEVEARFAVTGIIGKLRRDMARKAHSLTLSSGRYVGENGGSGRDAR